MQIPSMLQPPRIHLLLKKPGLLLIAVKENAHQRTMGVFIKRVLEHDYRLCA